MLKTRLTRRHGDTRRALALLAGLCLFLSVIEYLLPRPLPFMRLGLANLPLLLALDIFSPADFALLALLKVLGQGIISGTLFSYIVLFSAAGTFSSAAVMYGLRRLTGEQRTSFAGIGCAGALVSNGVQLLLARYLVFGAGLRYLAPLFLLSGFCTGTALGLFCEAFCRRSQWYAGQKRLTAEAVLIRGKTAPAETSGPTPPVPRRRDDLFNSGDLCIAGLLMALLFLFNPSPLFRIPQFLFFCSLARVFGKKNNIVLTLSVMAGVVFCNLLVPYGKVLAAIEPLRITQGSLFSGIGKAVTLEGLVMLSRACIRSDLRLPGNIGSLLGEALRLLELLRERKTAVKRGHVIEGIDRLLLELEVESGENRTLPPKPRRKAAGMALLAAMSALTAAVTIAGMVFAAG